MGVPLGWKKGSGAIIKIFINYPRGETEFTRDDCETYGAKIGYTNTHPRFVGY